MRIEWAENTRTLFIRAKPRAAISFDDDGSITITSGDERVSQKLLASVAKHKISEQLPDGFSTFVAEKKENAWWSQPFSEPVDGLKIWWDHFDEPLTTEETLELAIEKGVVAPLPGCKLEALEPKIEE